VSETRRAPPLLELREVSKTFGAVRANDAVSLAVLPGEIHALLGENGAGKSTLVKIIYGVLRPDSGTVLWNGEAVTVASPAAARKLGIGMVFQHFSLFEALTVVENVALGLDGAKADAALARRIVEVANQYGLPLDPHREVHTLSVGERQRIEIVRALLQNPRLLIMDEPTSVLTPQEVERLFATLRQLKAEGRSILYISHKLNEIQALCDTATILRGGKRVAECDPRRKTARGLAELMIGAELKSIDRKSTREFGEVRLAVRGLSLPGEGAFGTALRDISFEVRRGEILGVAGVAGNGQSELLLALSGERRAPDDEMILLDGEAIGEAGPTQRRALNMSMAPEERNGHAAVPDFSLADNVFLSARHKPEISAGGLLSPSGAIAYARRVIGTFTVKATGPAAAARSLSGGNLQKYIMGREIMLDPGVFVVSQPTWGVDAGASAFIRQAIVDLAAKGAAVVVISQDLDELLELADRLVVLNVGRASKALKVGAVGIDEIGLLMGGVHGEAPAEAAHAA
jgi:general nucleoside transport system ATP-binding protein